MVSKDKTYTVRFRVWVDEAEGPFLGIGRVILLEKIKETGSISGAAKSIKMSYRKAWQLIEDMNKRSAKPLVEKKVGGKTGGGAKLTKTGENAVLEFYKFQKEVKEFVDLKASQLKF